MPWARAMVIKQLSPDGNGALLGEPEEVVSVALSDLSVLVWAVEDCEDAIEKTNEIGLSCALA